MDTKSKLHANPRDMVKAYIKWLQAENLRKDKQIAALQAELTRLRVKHGTQEG